MSSALISWTAANSGTIDGYRIDDSTDGVNFSRVTSVSGAATTSVVVSVPKGHNYFFRVSAFNQGGGSTFTTSVQVSL